jgi:hypothetical protein
MAIRNCKYSIVELSDNWTGTSVKDARIALTMGTEVTWGEISARISEKNKVASFAGPDTALPLPKTAPRKVSEQYDWSPTQHEVDAYVSSLESEVSQEGVRMRQRRAEQRAQPALVPVRRSNYPVLFWCVVAAAMACASWLALLFT